MDWKSNLRVGWLFDVQVYQVFRCVVNANEGALQNLVHRVHLSTNLAARGWSCWMEEVMKTKDATKDSRTMVWCSTVNTARLYLRPVTYHIHEHNPDDMVRLILVAI